MKIKTFILSFLSLAVCGAVAAQELRGTVRDAEGQPLVGAAVYWAGTNVGASTDGMAPAA